MAPRALNSKQLALLGAYDTTNGGFVISISLICKVRALAVPPECVFHLTLIPQLLCGGSACQIFVSPLALGVASSIGPRSSRLIFFSGRSSPA